MRCMVEEQKLQAPPVGVHSSALSESEFKLFRDLIREECGMNIGVGKRTFLESRLRKRMGALGIHSWFEYYRLLRHSEAGAQELRLLLDILMICETSFFRNQPQFNLLKEVVVPELVKRKLESGVRMIRAWSAGCSTGQEPYSMIMSILESLPEAENWLVRAFASDLSFSALEKAHCGTYREDQIKGLDQQIISRYFMESKGQFTILDSIKHHLVCDYHNLKNDNGLRGLDIIFCRNVMIYFDIEEQKRLVSHFASSLLPGGFLFLGHAESLQGLSSRFSMVHRNKGIAYRLER